ncbi:MAG: tRNA dihydrouridine(20/20a) synthase DusA [Methylococcales bacterium]
MPLIDKEIPRHSFCVAPMLDWTDKHCRYFHRLLSRKVLLYTEMVTTGAILHGDSQRHLAFNAEESPVALQLGGSNPKELANCAQLAVDYGYQEVNLNVGCPSDRVQNGRFGACLMADPGLVAECVATMQQVVDIPVTVKCRIGIDEQDSYEALVAFVDIIAGAGCKTFIVHARKAWLSGLSPKQNREVPPLRYDVVYQLKQDFPQLEIILNGGLTTLAGCDAVLQHVDGVMLGREVYHNPYLLGTVDQYYYGEKYAIPSRADIIEAFMPYVQTQLQAGVRLNSMTRHILGLFHGMPGARAWRRHISDHACKTGADVRVVQEALKLTQQL